MIPALGMVILLQNPSTENGQIPGCSCILSVVGVSADAPCVLSDHAMSLLASPGVCECTAGFAGAACSTGDPCMGLGPQACKHGGTCIGTQCAFAGTVAQG